MGFPEITNGLLTPFIFNGFHMTGELTSINFNLFAKHNSMVDISISNLAILGKNKGSDQIVAVDLAENVTCRLFCFVFLLVIANYSLTTSTGHI